MLLRDTLRQEVRRGAAGSVVYLLNDTATAATFVVLSEAGAELQASASATVEQLGDPARTLITCPILAIPEAQEGAEVRISIAGREDIHWPFDVVVRPYRAELVTLDDLRAVKDHMGRVIEAQAQLRDMTPRTYVEQVVGPIARKRMDAMLRAELSRQHGDRGEFYRGSAVVDADRLFDVELACAQWQIYEAQTTDPEDGTAAQLAGRAERHALEALQAMGRIRLEPDGAPGADRAVMVRTIVAEGVLR